MADWISAGIGAGASVIGNVLGMFQTGRDNQVRAEIAGAQARQAQDFFLHNDARQVEFFNRNEALQREFAQNGIRWRTEDAKAAGLHPLYALGGSGASYSPSAYVGSSPSIPSQDFEGSGKYLSAMGQDISRAVLAQATERERVDNTARALQLQGMELQNQLLAAQIAKTYSQVGPAMPRAGGNDGGLPGQGQVPGVGDYERKPFEVQTSQPGVAGRGQAAGPPQPSVSWGYTADGTGLLAFPAKIPGMDEVEGPLGWEWFIRNRISPMLGHGSPPAPSVWKKAFPGAIAIEMDYDDLSWKPVYMRAPNMRRADSMRAPNMPRADIQHPRGYFVPGRRNPRVSINDALYGR